LRNICVRNSVSQFTSNIVLLKLNFIDKSLLFKVKFNYRILQALEEINESNYVDFTIFYHVEINAYIYNTGCGMLPLEPFKVQTTFYCSRLKVATIDATALQYRFRLSLLESSATVKSRKKSVRPQGKNSPTGVVFV